MPSWRSAIGLPRGFASLAAVLACAANVAAAAPARAPSRQVHYTMVTHRFAVDDLGHDPDERSLARTVEWAYPVFADTRDPATPALNAWARRESLKLLLVDDIGQERLTDEEIIAKAVASKPFVDDGIDQAVVRPDMALGQYRGVTEYSEGTGGAHPVHGISTHLYSLDRRTEIQVASLFKPDDDGVLEALFDAQPEAACPDASFEWAQASLGAIDTLTFEYPYRPGRHVKDVDCSILAIKSPTVTRLLKSPHDLRPAYELVEDAPPR